MPCKTYVWRRNMAGPGDVDWEFNFDILRKLDPEQLDKTFQFWRIHHRAYWDTKQQQLSLITMAPEEPIEPNLPPGWMEKYRTLEMKTDYMMPNELEITPNKFLWGILNAVSRTMIHYAKTQPDWQSFRDKFADKDGRIIYHQISAALMYSPIELTL